MKIELQNYKFISCYTPCFFLWNWIPFIENEFILLRLLYIYACIEIKSYFKVIVILNKFIENIN